MVAMSKTATISLPLSNSVFQLYPQSLLPSNMSSCQSQSMQNTDHSLLISETLDGENRKKCNCLLRSRSPTLYLPYFIVPAELQVTCCNATCLSSCTNATCPSSCTTGHHQPQESPLSNLCQLLSGNIIALL